MESPSSSSSESRGAILYTPTGSDLTDSGDRIKINSDGPFSATLYLDCGKNDIIRMTGGLTMAGPVRRTDWADRSSQSSGPNHPPESKVKEPYLWES